MPKSNNNELLMGFMERLKNSKESSEQLKEVVTETEIEEFIRDAHKFPEDYGQHRGFIVILTYILKQHFKGKRI